VPGPPSPEPWIRRIRYRVGENIRTRRRAANLTQEQVAAVIGLDNKTVSRAENGRFALSVDQCARIARALDVPGARLFEGVDDDRPPPG
jgi:transcriptional regulator with XRE-family HTH domain